MNSINFWLGEISVSLIKLLIQCFLEKEGEWVSVPVSAGRCWCEAPAWFLIWDGALGNLYCCCYPGKSRVKSGTGPRFVRTMWFLHTAAHGRILKVSRASISYLRNILPIGRIPSSFFLMILWPEADPSCKVTENERFCISFQQPWWKKMSTRTVRIANH